MFGRRASDLTGSMIESLLPERFRGRHVGHRAVVLREPARASDGRRPRAGRASARRHRVPGGHLAQLDRDRRGPGGNGVHSRRQRARADRRDSPPGAGADGRPARLGARRGRDHCRGRPHRPRQQADRGALRLPPQRARRQADRDCSSPSASPSATRATAPGISPIRAHGRWDSASSLPAGAETERSFRSTSR